MVLNEHFYSIFCATMMFFCENYTFSRVRSSETVSNLVLLFSAKSFIMAKSYAEHTNPEQFSQKTSL